MSLNFYLLFIWKGVSMMKKLSILLTTLTLSAPAFAWEFTEISVAQRSFEIKTDFNAIYLVSDIRCTATDGYDSLNVNGYYAPTGKWFYVGREIHGNQIRRKLNQMEKNLLPTYMNFCARVNRY